MVSLVKNPKNLIKFSKFPEKIIQTCDCGKCDASNIFKCGEQSLPVIIKSFFAGNATAEDRNSFVKCTEVSDQLVKLHSKFLLAGLVVDDFLTCPKCEMACGPTKNRCVICLGGYHEICLSEFEEEFEWKTKPGEVLICYFCECFVDKFSPSSKKMLVDDAKAVFAFHMDKSDVTNEDCTEIGCPYTKLANILDAAAKSMN